MQVMLVQQSTVSISNQHWWFEIINRLISKMVVSCCPTCMFPTALILCLYSVGPNPADSNTQPNCSRFSTSWARVRKNFNRPKTQTQQVTNVLHQLSNTVCIFWRCGGSPPPLLSTETSFLFPGPYRYPYDLACKLCSVLYWSSTIIHTL